MDKVFVGSLNPIPAFSGSGKSRVSASSAEHSHEAAMSSNQGDNIELSGSAEARRPLLTTSLANVFTRAEKVISNFVGDQRVSKHPTGMRHLFLHKPVPEVRGKATTQNVVDITAHADAMRLAKEEHRLIRRFVSLQRAEHARLSLAERIHYFESTITLHDRLNNHTSKRLILRSAMKYLPPEYFKRGVEQLHERLMNHPNLCERANLIPKFIASVPPELAERRLGRIMHDLEVSPWPNVEGLIIRQLAKAHFNAAPDATRGESDDSWNPLIRGLLQMHVENFLENMIDAQIKAKPIEGRIYQAGKAVQRERASHPKPGKSSPAAANHLKALEDNLESLQKDPSYVLDTLKRFEDEFQKMRAPLWEVDISLERILHVVRLRRLKGREASVNNLN